MKLDLTLDLERVEKDSEPASLTVIRLVTSYYYDNRGLHSKQSLLYCRRKSQGYNILVEDCNNVGATEVMPRIINLHACEDGYYSVNICNEKVDYWTGSVEDYDYKLVPYTDI